MQRGRKSPVSRKTLDDGGCNGSRILGDRRNQGQSIQPVPYHQACGGEGTRLSLSISHDIIVKHHGGSIEVDRQPGEFTEFRIVLRRVFPTHRVLKYAIGAEVVTNAVVAALAHRLTIELKEVMSND